MSRIGMTLALAALLAACGSVTPAAAGTYDVYACGGPAGAAQNAFVASADPYMSAYSICPPTSAPGTGVVTKANSNGGVAPYLHGAYQVFEAPPGASLASVTFNIGVIRLARYWTTGIVAYDDNFNFGDLPYGCYAGLAGCGVGTPSFSILVSVGLNGHRRFRFESRCGNVAGCDVSASTFSPANRALFSAANVMVRVQDFSLPAIVPRRGALWSDGWHRGVEEAWSSYYDNVGVMVTRLIVDGELSSTQDYRDSAWPAGVRCDFTRRRPCSDIDPGGLALDTQRLAEGRHAVRVEAVDAAGNVAATEHTIQVDNGPPARPAGLVLDGGKGWRSTNDFAVSWPAADDGFAPVAAAHYSVCPVQGDRTCVERSVRGDGISRLAGVSVPAPGEYELRVWLEDAAGNRDPERSAGPVRLRFDDVAPAAAFERLDEREPTRVSVLAPDRGSGLEGGTVEIRGASGGAWQELATRTAGDRLEATIDDESLPDGDYVLRAIVRDRAGNERTTQVRTDGSRMEVSLPLRTPTLLRLRTACRKAKRCRRDRDATGPGLEVRSGAARVRGTLRSATGDPVARATVVAAERPRTGAAFRRIAVLHTDAAGQFALRLGPGPSRMVRFRYDGASRQRPVTGSLVLLAPARSSIAPSRGLVRNGHGAVFRGRLRGRPVPDGGKLIDLQVFYRGRWHSFAAPRTDGNGRWSYRYRFEATVGRVAYRFRARIRREVAYPYELGHSRVVRVVVVG